MFRWFVEVGEDSTLKERLHVVTTMQKHNLRFTQRTSGYAFNVYANIAQMKRLFKECKAIRSVQEDSRGSRLHFSGIPSDVSPR